MPRTLASVGLKPGPVALCYNEQIAYIPALLLECAFGFPLRPSPCCLRSHISHGIPGRAGSSPQTVHTTSSPATSTATRAGWPQRLTGTAGIAPAGYRKRCPYFPAHTNICLSHSYSRNHPTKPQPILTTYFSFCCKAMSPPSIPSEI